MPPETPINLAARPPALPTRLDGFRRIFVGFDVFVSYHQADAAAYVERLEADLTRAGLRCFRDRAAIDAGQQVLESVRRAARLSSACVVIVSPRAHLSEYVLPIEVRAFLAAGRTVIPVSIDNAVRAEHWRGIQKFRWIDEAGSSLEASTPGANIVPEIVGSLRGLRLRVIRRLVMFGSLAAILLLSAGVLGVRAYDRAQMRRAEAVAASRLRQLGMALAQWGANNSEGSAPTIAALIYTGYLPADADYSDLVVPAPRPAQPRREGWSNDWAIRVFAFVRQSTELERIPIVFSDGHVETLERPHAIDRILSDSGIWSYGSDKSMLAPSSTDPTDGGYPRPTEPTPKPR